MPAPQDDIQAGANAGAARLVRVGLVIAGIAALVVIVVATGGISVPGFGDSSNAQASSQASLAAQQQAANRQWAAATCTDLLDWKNEIHRDETSLDLGFGPSARIEDGIAATGRLLNQLEKDGLPPAARNPQTRAQVEQLRSTIGSRLRAIEATADSAANGNLLAIGSLVSDLRDDRVVGTQVASDLRHVVSVDLGLSLVETRACRQLVGIPI
jgi:hypothetical protein